MTRQRIAPPNIRVFSSCTSVVVILVAWIVLAVPVTAQNPVPSTNQPLVPDAIAPGGTGFTLTVNGTGFVPASVVNWNGSPRATSYVSGSQLTATILASDIATSSTASVTVSSPSPGGGVSGPLFFPIRMPESSVSFNRSDFSSAGSNIQVVTVDFDGDGKLDLASADFSGTVRIFLGNGDGTFRVGQTYAACNAHGLAVGDFNQDGIPDLVVADAGCGEVTILLGVGDGSFTEGGTFSTGSGGLSPYSVAVGDFNSDGKLDLVTADETLSKASVLIGNGDGTFQTHVDYTTGTDSRKVVTGDFNGDGRLDFAVSSYNGVSVLLGKGDGTFQPETFYSLITPDHPYMLTADLNGDGMLDLAVASTAGSVSVLMGKGDGTFNSAVNYSTGGYSAAVAAADFNGDGILDLVFTNYATSNISLLLGRGDGTFGAFTTYPADSGARGLVVADFNGDGRLDLAVGNQFVDSISVFLGASSTLSTTSTTLASTLPTSVYGQGVKFTAEVSSASGMPTGTVIFNDGSISIGSATLASGTAAISVSSLSAGTHSITAVYQGSATFSGSTSAPVSQVVNAATTATTLSSSLNPAGTNQSVTFSATVISQYGGAATGSVTFSSGSQTLGTASLSGNTASLTTSFSTAGTYSISAKYNGDGNNSGSTSSTLSQVIIASTTTTLVSSLNPSAVGQAVTFTATVSSSAGAPPNGETITFKNGSSILGTAPLSAGAASLTTSSLAAGIYTITATYPGDATFAASTSPGLREVVNSTTKSATATTLVSSLNPSVYGQSVTWTATVTTSGSVPPSGKVNFTWSIYTIGSATLNSSGVATLTKSNLNADTYPLTAVYVGDASNLGSTSPVVSQVVTQATSSAALTSSPNPSTPGQLVTFTATITSPTAKPTGPVAFAVGKTVLGTAQLNGGKAKFTTSTLAVGSTKVTATFNGDSNIAKSSASVTQTVH